MNRSELKQLIKEEITSILKEIEEKTYTVTYYIGGDKDDFFNEEITTDKVKDDDILQAFLKSGKGPKNTSVEDFKNNYGGKVEKNE